MDESAPTPEITTDPNSKETRIERLKRGIAAESTPEHIRANMEAMLADLEAPEPPPAPIAPKPKKPRIMRPKPTPAPPKVELPPPVVPRELNEEESEALLEKYRERRLRKAAQQDTDDTP